MQTNAMAPSLETAAAGQQAGLEEQGVQLTQQIAGLTAQKTALGTQLAVL